MSASKFVSLGGTPADRPEGNGVSDDTAAINLAFSSGNRCGPKPCQSSTTSPAIVYFPAGTYYISVPVIDFYYTQIIGNSRDLPTVKAISNFTAFARIDDDRYQSGNAVNPAGSLGFNSTILFCRQIRNLVLDTISAALMSVLMVFIGRQLKPRVRRISSSVSAMQ